MDRLKAYVINLPEARDRLASTVAHLDRAGIRYEVVDAIFGPSLSYPHPDFDDPGYRARQGRRRIDREVGCYLSHVKALHAFLASDEEYGLILEDDASFTPELPEILGEAIAFGGFDMLRLSTVNSDTWIKVVPLGKGHHLGVALTRKKGAGGYLVTRHAAEVMVRRYVPMQMAYDLRFDLEWLDGLVTYGVTPVPISQEGFQTQIQIKVRSHKLNPFVRYLTVFPFRAGYESTRIAMRLFRLGQLVWRHKMSRRSEIVKSNDSNH